MLQVYLIDKTGYDNCCSNRMKCLLLFLLIWHWLILLKMSP